MNGHKANPKHDSHYLLEMPYHIALIGLLHPTGANDVLSYPLFVRDFFLSSFLPFFLSIALKLADPGSLVILLFGC